MEKPNSSAERVFGKYRLIQKVGVGGFGEVWKAQDTSANRLVALKVLHQGLMGDVRFIDKARNEAQLIGKLDHPNIVKVYEVSQIEGRLCIAMEFIDGQPLSKLIQSGQRFNFQQIVNIIEQIGAALDATHAKKIVHRDVKPENTLVDPNGNIHLVDFGLAYAAMSSLGQSSKSVGMGTAMYMSPEQAAGQPGGPTADIYSLGVIAYELLTGQPPFKADTLMGYMMAHQKQQPPDLIRLNPSISRDVQAVVLKALEKKPENRFKTASAFVIALQKAGDVPVSSARSRRSRILTCGCIGLVVVALIAAGAVWAARNGLLPLPPAISAIFNPQTSPTSISALLTPGGTISPTDTQPIPPASKTIPPSPAYQPSATSGPVLNTLPASTSTISPTEVPSAQPGASNQVVLVGTGVSIKTIQGSSSSSKGKLVILIQNGNGTPLTGREVDIYTQKKDLSGNWVVDQNVNYGETDNTGSVEFDLDPEHYIVASDFAGYNWGTASDVKGQADVPVDAGSTTQLTISLARLTVGFLRGDNSVIENQYVEIDTQKKDLAGNWVVDKEVNYGQTDNTGAISFDLTPGYYIISSNFNGYNWGNASDVSGMANLAVPAGQPTQLITSLGQLIVELTDTNGKPINGAYVEIDTQKKDVSGKLVTDQRVDSGYTDNTGQLTLNLTPGNYAVKIGDSVLFDVSIQSGKITITDGNTSSIKQ